jgi:hypothetical protein
MKGNDIRKLVALTLIGITLVALLWHSRATLMNILPLAPAHQSK